MAVRPVNWHEGMFLRPHHLQAAQRYAAHAANLSEKWDQHHNWGLRTIEIDDAALANYQLVVRRLQARMRDGTLVSVPEDGTLDAVDLRDAFGREQTLTVYLAVPVLNLGKANLAANGTVESTRYRVDVQDLEDENTGVNPQGIQVRLLNVKLLLSTQDTSGYEKLEIAQLRRSDRANATPERHPEYIPPILACDGWAPLQNDVLQYVYHRIGGKIKFLIDLIHYQHVTFDSNGPRHRLMLAQLQTLNEAYSLWNILGFANGVHPFPAYLELCRLVGQMSIFGKTYRLPDLPRYDHDDLARFYQVLRELNRLFDEIQEPDWHVRPFVGAGQRMEVGMEREWLEDTRYQVYVGVTSQLPANQCDALLRGDKYLNMKVASADRVERLHRDRLEGLKFSPVDQRETGVLPRGPVYFRISRDARRDEWQFVKNSLKLGVGLTTSQIEGGTCQGKVKDLNILYGRQVIDLGFELYVVPPSDK